MSEVPEITAEQLFGKPPKVSHEQARSADDLARKEAETSQFLKTGRGKHGFEDISNREEFERFTADREDAPKGVEDYTESERDAWLKKGVLPPAKKAAAAPKPETEKAGESTKETATAEEPEHPRANWTPEAHAERFKGIAARLNDEFKSGEHDLSQIMIPRDSAEFFFRCLADTRNPAGVIKHLSQHPDLVSQFAAPGTMANSMWTPRAEKQVMGLLYGLDDTLPRTDSTNGGNNKPAPEKKPKLVTSALPPPREIGGKGTVAEDEEEAALKRHDFRSYSRIANERDIAERKRGR